MGAERAKGMEKLVDDVWGVFYDKLKKEEVPTVRSKFGDGVNLFVPQMRLLLPMCANPGFPKSIYTTSYYGARRNADAILRKLGMPTDYYWKFEYWKKERALKSFSRVTNRIFRTIMRTNREGLLNVEKVSTDPEKIEIIVTLDECVECFGIEVEEPKRPICYYHAGTLTGIISAMLGKELDGYETECRVTGKEKCEFLIGNKIGREELEKYLNPGKIGLSKLHERFEMAIALDRKILRNLGNEVDLRYYQLVILNSLIPNPQIFSESSYEVGVEYGKELASFLKEHKKNEKELFESLKHLQIKEKKGAVEISAAEIAEISGLAKNEDLLRFLFGELAGILSVMRNEEMVYTKNTFEDDTLLIKFEKRGKKKVF